MNILVFSIGVAIGVSLGAITKNPAMLAFGVAIGLALSLCLDDNKKRRSKK